MRPVTLNLSGIQDPQVLAALQEIQRASQDTLQNDTSSSGSAMATLVGAAADEIAYFTSATTTAFTAITAFARSLLGSANDTAFRTSIGSNVVQVLASHMSADQTCVPSVVAVANIDTVDIDTQGGFDTVNFKYTPNVAGIYLFLVNIKTNQGGGVGGVSINLNGNQSGTPTGVVESNLSCDGLVFGTLMAIIAMNGSTDFVQVSAFGTTSNPFIATNPALTAFLLPS